MRKIFFLLLLVFILFPRFVFADCNSNGVSVIYINGVFTSQDAAKQDLKDLTYEYQKRENQNVNFILGYNQTHLQGIDDIFTSVLQAYGDNGVDIDLETLLLQLHGQLQTQKVLLVGYSQGTFYTNAAYDYLIQHGVDKNSIAVYNIATPADSVAGNGKYLTSSTDNVINGIVSKLASQGFARKPLPANITINLSAAEEQNPIGGHSLSDDYLANVPDRIVGDMQSEINNLSVLNQPSTTDSCFVPPPADALYQSQEGDLQRADTLAQGIAWVFTTSVSIAKSTYTVSQALAAQINQIVTSTHLLGASLSDAVFPNTSSIQPVSPTINQVAENQSPSVIIPTSQPQEVAPEDEQDQLDDIQEKLDVITAQVQQLVAAQNPVTAPILEAVDEKPQDTTDDKNIDSDNDNETQNTESSGGGRISYPQILISEVQTAGQTDEKQEFVELYNPNDEVVALTGWYLQRKTSSDTSWSTYASNTLFAGKTIPANGYFLIARTGYYIGLADIFTDNPITSDNSFALKDPNGDIVDKVGFGNAIDPEGIATVNPGVGQTIGRKVLVDGTEAKTGNNLADFELQLPTPKTGNAAYIAPPVTTPKDTISPQVSFTLAATQTNTTFPVNFTITDLADAVSPASGVASYIFRWQQDGGSWQQDMPVSVSGNPVSLNVERDFTGSDAAQYNFQVEATDAAGNISDWQPEIPATTSIDIPKKILINEIQTAGVTAKDEFIELYNPNNVDVNLAGFNLKKETMSGNASDLVSSGKFTGTISAYGYFLIASPSFTGSAIPDLYYSSASYSLASNNTILLYNNNGVLLDKVGFGSATDFETAPTVNPPVSESIERKNIGIDTDNNANDFIISTVPTPGDSFMQVSIKDDTTYLNNMKSVNPGAPFYTLTIQWQSPDAGVSYDVQYRLNNSVWSDWLSDTSETQDDFTAYYSLLNNDVYDFRVQAKDSSGNTSSWETATIDLSDPVVINELSISNANTQNDDQWIELYNRSDNDVDLTGWQIVTDHNSATLNGIVPAKGFFLLEKDENAISNIQSNQIYSGDMVGSGTIVLLNGNSRFIDQVYYPGGTWSKTNFYHNGGYYSLERVSAYSLGDDPHNWKFNNGIAMDGLDRNGNPIYGTPGAQNSVNQLYTDFDATFDEDTVLTPALSPYLFSGADTQVASGVTLTIQPGVVIKFAGTISKLTVHGTLNAVGTDASTIVFTSLNDDQYGGDTNGDGNNSAPAPGDWLGIYFAPDSVNSDLENVDVRYGGAVFGSSPYAWGDALWVDHAAITLKNSTVEDNKNRGLLLVDSGSTIDSVTFSNNSGTDWPPGLSESKAIFVEGGSPEISNSYFENNTTGIYIDSFYDQINQVSISATPSISNNNFVDNVSPIICGLPSLAAFANNQATGNQYNAIILAGQINQDTVLAPDLGLPYLIKTIMQVPENMTLTVNPGVVMDFQDNYSGLEIDGTLNAIGTQDSPIIFKSYYHDPDELVYGTWLGLHFTNTSQNSDLENVTISNAGAYAYSPQNQDFSAAIKVDQCAITLTNAVIENNANNGIWLVNSSSVIDSVQFLNHTTSMISLPAKAVYIQGGSPEIKNSQFQTQTYGIYEDSWTDPDTSDVIPATPNLHTSDPNDLEKNTFSDTDQQDIFDASKN